MAHIYVHIPFCRNKCFYCGFYSTASPRLKKDFFRALCREIEQRQGYLPAAEIETLYFGGGTPSFSEPEELEAVLLHLERYYTFRREAEKTIEVNPEDADLLKLKSFKQLGFNRISIGVQSFNDSVLKRINRTHSAFQAVKSIENAASAGFTDISADLIIGLPGSSFRDLEEDLKRIASLPLKHVSVYLLSIDSHSVLEHRMRKGEWTPESDDRLAARYERVSERLREQGYEHYEISNFAKEGFYSRHNTAYWQQKPYLGLGPSAHSYDLHSRQWNIAQVKAYIDGLSENRLNFERELLTDVDLYNEYIMTRLRTRWGAELKVLREKYASFWEKALPRVESYKRKGWLCEEEGRLRMTEKGWLVSDGICCDLFCG